ncbi:MAG: NAD(P)-dependent oxidoreductase [Patescibacteria group bacterium]
MKNDVNVLIFGAAGFLGTNLVQKWAKERPSANITAVDLMHPFFQSTRNGIESIVKNKKSFPKIHFIEGDIRDRSLLKRLIPNADVIYNCAAQTSHQHSFTNPVFDASINCIGNLELLSVIKELNPRAKVIYPSSSTVIGKATRDTTDETDREDPRDIYSANKCVAEKYYQIFNWQYGLRTVVLRFANLYGPYGKADPLFGFVNHFIHRAWHDQEIKIFGDGLQKRNVMFVDDAVEILWRAAWDDHLIGQPYFAVHHEHWSVKDIASEIVRQFSRGKIVCIPWPEERKRMEIDNAVISGELLKKTIDWKPKYTLQEGLLRTKEFFVQNEKGAQ